MTAEARDESVTPMPIPPDARGVLLFGGTFDPPHRGHTEPAVAARDAMMPPGSWLVFVPAARSPHKSEAPATSAADRAAMLRLAIAPLARSAVWTDEIDRAERGSAEPSWWVETLRRARRVLPPGTPLRFLIGSDQAAAFHRWRAFRAILALAEPVVVLREPIADAATLDAALEASGEWTAAERRAWQSRIAPAPIIPVSATAIRAALNRITPPSGEASRPLASVLDGAVLEYARSHGLYADWGFAGSKSPATIRPPGPGSSLDAAAMPDTPDKPRHFIRQIIDEDMRSGRWGGRVHTRFPPEPNGYLHVGHAKSICLNFGLAQEYGGRFNLRFDDTNPLKEEMEFVEGIKRDVLWLGADWSGPHGGGIFWASDYFQQMYDYAVELVKKGRAYVCDLTAEQTREYRGTLTEPGRPSPYRDRSVEENLDLLDRMRRGEFPDGSRTLRAKIDMASPNLNLRDPVMYRILHATHHNTGDAWCIYPMYDWAHGLEDSIEGITHSICTLEFENHRPLYDWFIDAINEGRTDDGAGPWGRKIPHPQQIEFAKLALTTVLMSKRNLRRLVEEGHVAGWDDPRMPTICAMRRRGYTPESLRTLCEQVGVTKYNSVTEVVVLENAVRDHLNKAAPRRMAVLRPLRVVITNWADGGDPDRTEWMDAVNNPEDPGAGTRHVPFTRELFVERDDFMEDPPRGYFRLAPGVEVRLRYAYWITCREVVKDTAGNAVELRCTYDPATRGGETPPPDPDGKVRKVKATLHWVSATHCRRAEVRLFDRLFVADEPGKRTGNFLDDLNPASLETIRDAAVEPGLIGGTPDEPAWPDCIRRFQFERLGYFCVDPDSTPDRPVFNRTVTLKDTWAKVAAKGG
ncbi:MAG: glutamine--tRNA ligase/YqeY domain fusion protein [Leptolyngbya sp. PLA2]|nr:glutamine--tRNA ligase/YqeY domain fusion protein [Leptolyngbya sp.]MCE7970851.1 glutamine--tRNA ligase/YqeY domain fusion protein [Leptolyngbya sp. PL-A2]MCQ3940334.1 hypothetical protein [cyanobacterium CYA1]MCZ7633690.1 glutamine--tRNA ligase/YqeY domain fusion protein [Phycisphaerales bacterium]MDL1904596.1 glutamine--tRNA ligase/YqeY domain fusion protein [Synechococcales cyanobacterium CNB]GIK17874.1 MAG: hypothetical protein BroJett004_00380 [Planctomycetota bacterium]